MVLISYEDDDILKDYIIISSIMNSKKYYSLLRKSKYLQNYFYDFEYIYNLVDGDILKVEHRNISIFLLDEEMRSNILFESDNIDQGLNQLRMIRDMYKFNI